MRQSGSKSHGRRDWAGGDCDRNLCIGRRGGENDMADWRKGDSDRGFGRGGGAGWVGVPPTLNLQTPYGTFADPPFNL